MLSSPLSALEDQDPLSAYRWKHRLLLVYVPDTESGRSTLQTFRASLDERMEDVRDRDLLIVPVGDLPRTGDALRPAVDVDAPGRSHVRRRFGLQGPEVQLLLIGKDGGVKARQSGVLLDLERVFEQIDSMPMRPSGTAATVTGLVAHGRRTVMEWLSLANLLQLIVGLGLLNVWLVRRRSATAYRGRTA